MTLADHLLDLDAACPRTWDLAVIGAGPAGAATALLAVRKNLRVILVEKSPWPRDKPCGCCLSAAALRALAALGLANLPARLGAAVNRCCRLWLYGEQFPFPLPPAYALSRRAFDAALLQAAADAGAAVMTETSAAALGPRGDCFSIALTRPEGSAELCARVVVAADGIAGSFLRKSSRDRSRISPRSRIGAAATITRPGVTAGEIQLVIGDHGYVGLTQIENGGLNIASALDPDSVAVHGGVAGAATALLRSAGFATLENDKPVWRGVPPLTRRRRPVWSQRLLFLGDSAGYVEPFTGQGIAWSLQCALLLADLLPAAVADWSPAIGQQWQARHRAIRRQHRWCRVIAGFLRRPRVLAALLRRRHMTAPLVRHIIQHVQGRYAVPLT